jgi:hypothetical protein
MRARFVVVATILLTSNAFVLLFDWQVSRSSMRYFVYAMNGKDPAPAAGGDTESWFFFYKWDVGGDAFVPLASEPKGGLPVAGDLLWFVLDEVPIGYAPVVSVMEVDGGGYEIHYDTQKIIGPGKVVSALNVPHRTGLARQESMAQLTSIKRHYDTVYPARPSSAPQPVPAKAVTKDT